MSPGSSTESYPAFARIGLRENPGKNLNQFKVCHDSLYAVMWLADEPREFNLPILPQRCITYEVEKLPSKYGVHSEDGMMDTVSSELQKCSPRKTRVKTPNREKWKGKKVEELMKQEQIQEKRSALETKKRLLKTKAIAFYDFLKEDKQEVV
ncbi:hypothetical protein ANN_27115 [Periplaneta americana]|uniref:Uncharacterized protein n=1 Tax=Periplaneta americana TaxID=6978 RepID=A0ABQ8RX94_PERAM|nr:hypothetical protein ANN_27115 [Periplaneta americana]